MAELAKPGRDPRESFQAFEFAEGVNKISDLTAGMKLPGIITNVTAFGAFVDVGVHQDGLVHISQMANRFVKDPSKVVKVQQKVKVTVLDIDLKRNRISLSMKGPAEKPRTVPKTKHLKTKNQDRRDRQKKQLNGRPPKRSKRKMSLLTTRLPSY